MPTGRPRRYDLVFSERTGEKMRQHLPRQQKIRNVGLSTNAVDGVDRDSNIYSELTVVKSPRAPMYEIHYVKTKKDGIKMIPVLRSQTDKITRKGGDKEAIKPKKTKEDQPEVDEVDETDSKVKDKRGENTDDMVGLRVIACNKKDGLYYPGTIARHLESTYAIVSFNFNKRQKVRTHLIIPMSGAVPRPELAVGDHVLVKVSKQHISVDCYVPAIIEFVPVDFRAQNKFYSVLLYNGQKASTMRRFIVKIGKARFDMAVKYMAHVQGVERSKPRSISRSGSRSRSDSDRTYSRSSNNTQTSSKRGGRHHSRSRRRTESRSNSRSRSRSSARSYSSRSPSRSRSEMSNESWSKSRSQNRRRSRSSSGSSTVKSRSRSPSVDSPDRTPAPSPVVLSINPVLEPRPRSRTPEEMTKSTQTSDDYPSQPPDAPGTAKNDEKDKVIGELQYQLDKQLRKQMRQEQSKVKPPSDTNDSPKEKNTNGTNLRKIVPGLYFNKEVLARWSDDGWYYRGRVLQANESGCYLMDNLEHIEKILQEDILSDDDNRYDAFQPQDNVIALHPKYVFSYAPGEILQVFDSGKVKVKFYDGSVSKLTPDEVYKSSKDKFKKDVEYIIEKEKGLLGKAVVARDDLTGIYRCGFVNSKRDDVGQQYDLEWCDGGTCKQTSIHIFEFHGKDEVKTLEYVLAPVDSLRVNYKPALVLQPLRLEFSDGSSNSEVREEQCFRINKEYYTNAANFLKSRQR